MMIRQPVHRVPIWVLLIALSTGPIGCSTETVLIPAPYLNLTEAGRKTFDSIPTDQRNPEMEILYAADRSMTRDKVMGIEFGTGRSGVLTVGRLASVLSRASPGINWLPSRHPAIHI